MGTAFLPYGELERLVAGRMGKHDVPCPLCGPDRHAAPKRRRPVLRVWNVSPGFISYHCVRCGARGYARHGERRELNPSTFGRIQAEIAECEWIESAARLEKAAWLWRQRLPISGSPAEWYLRNARGYGGPLPATLGFLAARGKFPPTMIAAFGIPSEPEPSVVAIAPVDLRGVHLTRLLPDGSDRERGEQAKIMVGRSAGAPIVVAPMNDGLGLIVTEGIEDALSAHEATGLGAWAAGSASRLFALAEAVPACCECLTIIADDDKDGRRHAAALAGHLRARDVETRVCIPNKIARRAAA